MKKILGFILSLIILSCSPKIVLNDKGDVMVKSMNGRYSVAQFNSMCVADTLPKDLLEWQRLNVKDYETDDRVSLYLYMKQSNKTESVYKVEIISDDSLKIIKRIITE